MVGGTLLKAAAPIGGNYLAPALFDWRQGRTRRESAALQAPYAKYTRDRIERLDWIAINAQIKGQAKQNFTNIDYAFKLYNKTNPDKPMLLPKEP